MLAALIGLKLIGAAVGDEPPPMKLWFVQISTQAADADPSAAPGRIDLDVAGHPFGCAWASYYRPTATEIRLVPINIGWRVVAPDPSAIHVRATDELGRVGAMKTVIKEMIGETRMPVGEP